ncbi:MAG: nucleotidyltransferase domain-containing protein [Patescibacteria group bacterium]|nr:nucleotidyltransferase domain-containing protein [Patescibacteria group bacterium]
MAKKISLEKIKKIVKNYVQLLEADGFDIEKVILYGSYAKGTPHRDSDIDICLISKKFGKDPHEEGKYLFRKLWHLKNANLEPIGYSPKDFYHKNNSPLIYEIQKNGIELKIK